MVWTYLSFIKSLQHLPRENPHRPVLEIDLKKAAKLFANKFATGSSVTKNPQGLDEIVVQGDVSDDIFELIISTWQQVLSCFAIYSKSIFYLIFIIIQVTEDDIDL